jgi:endogenous inhibitor of DNA gyrase (YacG/DUF329 family)
MSRAGKGDQNRPRHSRKCPICGGAATAESKPFCSRRCADIDLNRWLSGAYAIPGAELDDVEAEAEGAASLPDEPG